MSIHQFVQSVHSDKCICKLKGYLSQEDEIWHEDRCSDKVNAHSLRILLKII